MMTINTCYTVPIKKQLRGIDAVPDSARKIAADDAGSVRDSLMKSTADVCLAGLKICVSVFLDHWNEIAARSGKVRKGYAEHLIHSTKDSTAVSPEFDAACQYMPSGMRRALVADALGMISSWESNHRDWETADLKDRGKEPILGMPSRYELTFYFQERNMDFLENGVIFLKLYDGKSWKWYGFTIAQSDARYLSGMLKSRKLLSPSVLKVRGSYQIRFCFEEKKALVPDNPLHNRILAVDLGINSPASWSVMESDGTVCARGRIHARAEEDRLHHLMNRKKKYQQAGKHAHCVYRWMNDANKALSIITAKRLIQTAELYDVDVIVFEHLDTGSKKHGGQKERLHLWRARDVQQRVENMAHQRCMRISRVCAWGTSKYAFDGSGPVSRGYYFQSGRKKYNYSVATFRNGKQYNCDISASCNIGARYYLREYQKKYPDLQLPCVPQRTLSTLWNTVRAAEKPAA